MIDELEAIAGNYGYAHEWNILRHDILAAVARNPLAYVKPKPLEWEVVSVRGEDGYLFSGPYEITPSGANLYIHKIHRGDVVLVPDHLRFKANGDQKPAQAAAYEDLCKRVGELF